MAVNATNDWLNTWPTCYQVDVDGNKLYHCSSDYMDRFYYISTQAGVSSQISGLVDDKVVFSGKIGTDVVSDAGSGSTQSAVPPIAVVDMDLIGTLSSKSGNFENDEVVVDGDADLISDRETAHKNTDEDDLLDKLDCFDDSWVETEVRIAEDAHGRYDRHMSHQVDGADDSDYIPPRSI
ncbi:hypothetical protein IW150_003963, partial [Coemansia sp. RSA 2607]